jgi:thymidylate synthase (FAD)
MPLTIDVLANTMTSDDAFWRGLPHDFRATPGATDADALAEFSGRACFQSWSRPNPATATNSGYLANILDHGHFSVLEHASVTLYVQGVSRSLTHELVRHRHFSPSQLSQRFVDESEVTFVVPPAEREIIRNHFAFSTIEDREEQDREIEAEFNARSFFNVVRAEYALAVDRLTKAGLPRKEVREAARAVLPNCTETKLVLTGNLRCWREFFFKRDADGVDREMREFASAALAVIRPLAPASFQDFEVPA